MTAMPVNLPSTSPGTVAVAEAVLGPIKERAKEMLLSTKAGKENAELLDEVIEAASEEIRRTVRSLSVVAAQLDPQQGLTPPAEGASPADFDAFYASFGQRTEERTQSIERSAALRRARAAAHEKLAIKVASTAVQALLMVV